VPEALRSERVYQTFKRADDEASDSESLIAQASQFAELAELIRSGEKIAAIKRYREITGTGLKAAKDAVEALEDGRPVTLVSSQDTNKEMAYPPITNDPFRLALFDEAAELVAVGRKIEAIKQLRSNFKLDLQKAKEIAETIQAGDRDRALESLQLAHAPARINTPSIEIDPRLLGRITAGVGTGIGCTGIFLTSFILLITLVPILFALSQPGAPLFETWTRINPFSTNPLILSFGQEGTGPGLFEHPRHIALDGQGNIYVADYRTGRIQRFDLSGNYQSLWRLENQPYIQTLTATRDGRVYIVHSGRIFIYEGQTGRLSGEVPLPGDQQIFVDDVALTADGSLVIVASGDHLYRLDPFGQLNLEIPDAMSGVSGDSELNVRVAVDGLGNIFLLGTFNNAVFKYSAEGAYLTRFGGSGEEPGQFRATSAIALDSQGRVLVSDSHGIQIFDNDGRYLEKVTIAGHAFGLVLDPQDNLYIVTNKPQVYKYSIKTP
jgi:ribosomal protein L7/L12/DNA-binding beta-propeller fold protein YncE